MFRNYLKTAVRNLLRYKGFSFVNIASLTIGLVGCLVIGLFVWDEWQFDRQLPGGDRIYRIYNTRSDKGVTTQAAVTAPAYASFLQRQYPEVEATARILMAGGKYLVEAGEKRDYEEKGWIVDSSFFRIFSLPFREGNAATALRSPNSIVLSAELAQHYFGSANPIGKTVRIDKGDMTVTGVLAPLPDHFHLNFRYLMPLAAAGIAPERMERWTWNQFYTYVKLKPNADMAALQDKFQAYVKKDIYPTLTIDGSTFLPFFQPLAAVHLQSADFIYDNAIRGNGTYVKGLTIIALFVLVIACFNFINLSTARSFRRAKEIGVRKVVGAERGQLVGQFIGETILLSLLSLILASVITWLVVPSLNQFTGKAIAFRPWADPLLLLSLLGTAAFIGTVAGIYPALVLSGFRPIQVLKNTRGTGGGSGPGWLRQSLVVVQFALSALLIVASSIVYRQVRFMNSKDLGFNKEQVIYFQVRGDVEKQLSAFKDELRRSAGIRSVTSGYGLPGDQYAGDNVKVPGKEGLKNYSANVFIGDFDYVKTLGLKLVAGRDFSRDRPADTADAFLINETAVRDLGFGTPQKAIGQPVYWEKWDPDSANPVKKGSVVGVVQDFHYKSLHEKVTATVIQIYPPALFKVAVKLNTADLPNTIAYIQSVWNRFSPGFPLDYKFMDETYGAMYRSEEKLGSLLWIFTVMAIVVGCMGLFGLAALSAQQRTKEIGVRRVLGASVASIVGLLSRSFIRLVLLASLIAFPVAWWAMKSWLNDFPYRVAVSWWIFLLAAAAAVLITLLTVSVQSIRAAQANPVNSLQTD